ncbi:MAG: proprotein convertase P-domain-containing protein [Thermodesulfobacteriota bacterium]|nr:proprotein convertase P-domain-containing protein [Thermodesulfobacteriota bacterium]
MTRYKKGIISALVFLAFTLGVGVHFALAETNTYASTDVPKTFHDYETIASTITLTAPCDIWITDINVQINIDHDEISALDIFLIAPDGTQIELSTGNGGSGNGYSDTVFDDEAATSITAGTAPFAGAYQPEEPLSGCDGKSREGTWALQVTDTDAFGDTGTLNSWSLTIETTDTKTTSRDVPKALPSSVVAKDIPDPGTTSTITSCNALEIVDVNVQLDINHTFDADLDIFLIAPDGTRIELSTDNGGSGDHFSNTVFDDEAATAITAGTAPFAGSYQPEEPLSGLDGMTANGTWTLEITDDYVEDTGSLNSWSLIFVLIDPDYGLSTYVSGLSAQPAGLTVDPSTGTLYFADWTCDGQLQRISRNRTVSIVTSDFAPNGGPGCLGMFYHYETTDIQFLNGHVYVPVSNGTDAELVRIDTTSGLAVVENSFAGFGGGGGLTVKTGQILVTSGDGAAKEIQSYDRGTQTASVALDVSPLEDILSVEYDYNNNATYFWSDGTFYRSDLDAGTYSAIPSYFSELDDFVITPDGNYMVAANPPNIELISVADGSSTLLTNALTSGGRHDMVPSYSSSGVGCSLYIVDGNRILEISGFAMCRSLPTAILLLLLE